VITRSTAVLADGRELIYFDESPGADRALPDRRALPPAAHRPELRFDPLLEEWVIVAAHRQTRMHLPASDDCPLCPSRDGRATEIPSADYDVVVFENRMPSLGGSGEALVDAGHELFHRRGAAGRCEVICFSAEHEASFADLPLSRVRTVVEAWIDRTRELAALPGVEQVFAFENRGREIGVTLEHPHGQIYAYPFVTPRTDRMLAAAGRHRDRTGRNLFADVLAAEHAAGERVVARGEHWTAFVPAAARWPVELHLFPHRRVATLEETTEAERVELCAVYRDALRRLDGVFGVQMPYIAGWHQAPVHADPELPYLHLQLLGLRRGPGRLKHLAGSESAMGVWINDITPERTAAALRAAGPAPTRPAVAVS
jgi:UDPglucose--hexose-1-phosphate uridylyltransferase